MDIRSLNERISHLEFINDQISAELQSTDKLLRSIGFSEGLKSVKVAAQEIFDQEKKKSN
jgi:hypothetical protein